MAASAAMSRSPSSWRTAAPVATRTRSPSPAPTASTATNSGPSPFSGVTFRSLKSARPGALTVETVLPTTRQSCMSSSSLLVVNRALAGTDNGRLRIGLEVVDEARLGLDAGKPRSDRREGARVDPGLVCVMRVRVERDVRDRVPTQGEELTVGKTPLEHLERRPSRLEPLGEHLGALRIAAGQVPEAGRADVRLEQVLLEEEPLVDARSVEALGGHVLRALC